MSAVGGWEAAGEGQVGDVETLGEAEAGSRRAEERLEAFQRTAAAAVTAEEVGALERAYQAEWARSMRESEARQARLLDELVGARMALAEREEALERARERVAGGEAAESKGREEEGGEEAGKGKDGAVGKGSRAGGKVKGRKGKGAAGAGGDEGAGSVRACRRAVEAAQRRADEAAAAVVAAGQQAEGWLALMWEALGEAKRRVHGEVAGGASAEGEGGEGEAGRGVAAMGGAMAVAGRDVRECLDHPGRVPAVLLRSLRRAVGGGDPAAPTAAAAAGGDAGQGAEEAGTEGAGGEGGVKALSAAEEAAAHAQVLAWHKWAAEQRAAAKKQIVSSRGKAKAFAADKQVTACTPSRKSSFLISPLPCAQRHAPPCGTRMQAEVLAARDRVMGEATLNTAVTSPLLGGGPEGRWELTAAGLWEALSHSLLSSVSLRHDRRAALLRLKADPRLFFVDLSAWDSWRHATGGTDELLLRLRAAGVPTRVEVMWVPVREWDPASLYTLPARVVGHAAHSLSSAGPVRVALQWYVGTAGEAAEETFFRFVWPAMPRALKALLKLDYSEGAAAGDVVALERMGWLAAAERRFAKRSSMAGRWAWWLVLPAKAAVALFPLRWAALPAAALAQRLLVGAPGPESETAYKTRLGKELLRRVGKQEEDEEKAKKEKKVKDSIREAFDRMKRVRRPAVRLSDFAGMDAVKEEVQEVITFLRDPSSFQRLGARPPRGVLITGGSGVGKSSLALAIAAEARVPVVDIKSSDVDPGGFVGQGAANVRELFKMARDMAPMLILMEDFEEIGGVRGAAMDTRLQDKEAIINQLLVELDGFETQEGVVLLAITDNPAAVDPALRRPGRMDRVIEVPLPTAGEREKILRRAAAASMDPRFLDAVDWRFVAEQTGGLKPTDLRGMPRRILLAAGTDKFCDEDELAGTLSMLELYHWVVPALLRRVPVLQRWESGVVERLGLELTAGDVQRVVADIDFSSLTHLGMDLTLPDTAKHLLAHLSLHLLAHLSLHLLAHLSLHLLAHFVTAPARPLVTAPARPLVTAPARPLVTAAPARPLVTAAPARPLVTAPARPLVTAPARPLVTAPAPPLVTAPARPLVTAAPARPLVTAPARPLVTAPARPLVTAPARPLVTAPARPLVTAPARPLVTAPAPPLVTAPAPPLVTAPARPLVTAAPARPLVTAPARPLVTAPARPLVTAPARPLVTAPARPLVTAPAPPLVTAPAPPLVTAPAPPLVTAPAPPLVTAPAPRLSLHLLPRLSLRLRPNLAPPLLASSCTSPSCLKLHLPFLPQVAPPLLASSCTSPSCLKLHLPFLPQVAPPLHCSTSSACGVGSREVLAALLPSFDRVDNIWLNPNSWEVRTATGGRWEVCMGQAGERCAWGKRVRGVHGASRWEVCMGQAGGRCAWGKQVRGVHGASRWEVCMGQAGERCAWAKQGVGFTRFTRAADGSLGGADGGAEAGGGVVVSRAYTEQSLVALFGSHIAAALLLPWGHSNNLATPQLQQAYQLAERMVMEWGWGPDDSPFIFQTHTAHKSLALGRRQEAELKQRVQQLHDAAFERAHALLARNRRTLQAVVDALCTHDAVDRQELLRIMADTSAVPENEPFELFPYSHPTHRAGIHLAARTQAGRLAALSTNLPQGILPAEASAK
ncbi:unnamed protein product [Closterium sp. Yama58-4]|nr:unnamed protein product [Closterium sp. Yama58-4]